MYCTPKKADFTCHLKTGTKMMYDGYNVYLGMQDTHPRGGTNYFQMKPVIGGWFLQHKLELLFPSRISIFLHMLCQ